MAPRTPTGSFTAFVLLLVASLALIVGGAFASIPLGAMLATSLGFGPIGATPYDPIAALARLTIMAGCLLGALLGGFALSFALADIVFAHKGRR